MSDATCSIDGCGKPRKYVKTGWCSMHYARWRRNGDPNTVVLQAMHGKSLEERLWARVDKSGDCWEWTGANRTGYGVIGDGQALLMCHRLAYELTVGPIPEGLQIDHLCRNRSCVNPDHLEPVTQRENILRGDSPPAYQARQTHCKRGHEFTPENTRISPAGKRHCRACHRMRERIRRERQKSQA